MPRPSVPLAPAARRVVRRVALATITALAAACSAAPTESAALRTRVSNAVPRAGLPGTPAGSAVANTKPGADTTSRSGGGYIDPHI